MEQCEGHDTHESRVRDEAEDLPNQETQSQSGIFGVAIRPGAYEENGGEGESDHRQ